MKWKDNYRLKLCSLSFTAIDSSLESTHSY